MNEATAIVTWTWPSCGRTVGAIAIEIQYDQSAPVRRLLEQAGFGDVQVRRDFEDHERVVSGRVG